MRIRTGRLSVPVLAAASLLASVSCGEQTLPTAMRGPAAAVQAAGPNNPKVKITKLQLSSNTLRIDGTADSGQVHIGNSGAAIQSGVTIQGVISQGAASREAVDIPVNCSPGQDPSNDGSLPSGGCDMEFPAVASNSSNGDGTLVPGGAVFTLSVRQDGTELVNKTLDVTLVATPSIVSVDLASTQLAIDGPSVAYTADLQNPTSSLPGVLVQAYIKQGVTATRAAGGAVVSCGSAPGVFTTGTCTFSSIASASNSNSGTGMLVPGDAVLELDLLQSSGGTNVLLDSKAIPVTLVSSSPVITSLSVTSAELGIDGADDHYTAVLQNWGFPVSDVILQGYIVQGAASRAAAGMSIDCGAGPGVLPTTGSCTVNGTFNASNSNAGTGTLVPGAAQLVLHLDQAPTGGSLTELDSMSVAVTLVSSAPTIASLSIESVQLTIDGDADHYTAVLQNYGPPVSDVLLQGYIVQGGVTKAAGGFSIDCGAGAGVLPTTASCTINGTFSAMNGVPGSGTLEPGAAQFVLHLYHAPSGGPLTDLDSKSVEVGLVSSDPCSVPLPTPVIQITSVVTDPNTGNLQYNVSVTNYADFDDALFAASPQLDPCGLNTNASRTWVDLYKTDDTYLFGFCAFYQAVDMTTLWFEVPPNTQPFDFYVKLTDRLCGRAVQSDPISIAFTG